MFKLIKIRSLSKLNQPKLSKADIGVHQKSSSKLLLAALLSLSLKLQNDFQVNGNTSYYYNKKHQD